MFFIRINQESYLFFLSVLKKQKTNTLHLYSMCDGTKTLKDSRVSYFFRLVRIERKQTVA